MELQERSQRHTAAFLQKISPEPTSGCWLWSGYLDKFGYGRCHHAGFKTTLAHRVSYELSCGPIPAGLSLDHLCRVTACVNPAHLEPVTHLENVRRGLTPIIFGSWHRAKTHCPSGHPYSGDNLHVYRGERVCRACGRAKYYRNKLKLRRAA